MSTKGVSANQTRQIVIVGASYSGASATHSILKDVVPTLPKPHKYHIHLVSASSHFFPRSAAPRALVSEELIPSSKVFLPIEDGFKQYPSETFTFTHGTATALDTAARAVTITLPDGTTKILEYHALVLATGSSPATPLLGLHGQHTLSNDAMKAFQKALPEAKSIIIAGGGPSGVETAGEIGEYLNGAAKYCASRPAAPKAKITLITADKKLLPTLRPAIATYAEKLLNRVGVDVVYNTRVESAAPVGAGSDDQSDGLEKVTAKTTVRLSNGKTLEADLFIPALGVKPNASFVGKDLLNERGQIETNPSTLRVDKAGPRVYAIGDVASYSHFTIFEILKSVPVAIANIKKDLLEFDEGKERQGQDKIYDFEMGESQIVPVGQSKGVGALFGWRLPSIFVWLIKGRDFMISRAPQVIHGTG